MNAANRVLTSSPSSKMSISTSGLILFSFVAGDCSGGVGGVGGSMGDECFETGVKVMKHARMAMSSIGAL